MNYLSYRLTVPLFLVKGKTKPKKYWLNLNNYRNWAFHLNNDLKIQFKNEINIPEVDKPISICSIKYRFFYPSNQRRDIDGSLAVIAKYAQDALVDAGVILDDDYTVVKKIVGEFAGIDRANPRCEIEIIGE